MKAEVFIDEVQHRAHMQTRGEAEHAIEATLRTFGERLPPLFAAMIASELPPGVGKHLDGRARYMNLSLAQFYDRVAEREARSVEDAKFHSQCVLETVCEAISYGEVLRLRQQLPEEFRPLLHFGSAA